MEALNFLKFWKPNSTKSTPLVNIDCGVGDDDEEDSFFELELALPDFENNKNYQVSKTNENSLSETNRDVKRSIFKEEPVKQAGDEEHLCLKSAFSSSPKEPISKRKIMPLEPISKPQSPIALLKTSPKFRIFFFNKSKSSAEKELEKTEEAESYNVSKGTQEQKKQVDKFLAVNLKASETPLLKKESSLNIITKKPKNQSSEEAETEAEKVQNDAVQKYLKLIKPFYAKASRRYTYKVISTELSITSPASSPSSVLSMPSPKGKYRNIQSGLRSVYKHLGKSKSVSVVNLKAVPLNRRNDSVSQQDDGIQSAILHCKKSFNSSKGSLFPRSTSDSSSMKSFSSDYSLSSHLSYEATQNKSARSSIEEDYYGVGI